MLTTHAPRRPALLLARGRIGVRLCIRPNAFGNALGDSIASNIGGPSQQELELQKQEDARDAAMFAALGGSPAERNPYSLAYGMQSGIGLNPYRISEPGIRVSESNYGAWSDAVDDSIQHGVRNLDFMAEMSRGLNPLLPEYQPEAGAGSSQLAGKPGRRDFSEFTNSTQLRQYSEERRRAGDMDESALALRRIQELQNEKAAQRMGLITPGMSEQDARILAGFVGDVQGVTPGLAPGGAYGGAGAVRRNGGITNTPDSLGLKVQDWANTARLGKITGDFSAIEPGALPENLAGTFAGGRYTTVILRNDTILYRAGTASQPLGQFFSLEQPTGVLQTRIDKAVLPEWPGGGKSPIDTFFAVKIPAGTQVHVGEVGTQSGFYIGGTQQIVVPKPWTINGVQVINSSPLK